MLKKLTLSVLLICVSKLAFGQDLTVYSARQEHLIKPMLDQFSNKTNIKIKLHTDSEGPIFERLRAEGAKTPADVLITSDAGNLWKAANAGFLQAVDSKILQTNIPVHLRDPDNMWFGLTVRARTIVYARGKVDPTKLSTYQALSGAEWAGKLCLRTSKQIYNQSLVATMIEEYGYENSKKVVAGWIDNLATTVFPNDTGLINAIVAGQCEVGIVNSYYLGRLLAKSPDLPVAIFWANQKDRGTHVNISGGGIIKNSKNFKQAQALLEFLSEEEAQRFFADVDYEYPVNKKVKPNPIVAAWGEFKPDYINISIAGKLQARANLLMGEAGYK